jgi:hypothetical protein
MLNFPRAASTTGELRPVIDSAGIGRQAALDRLSLTVPEHGEVELDPELVTEHGRLGIRCAIPVIEQVFAISSMEQKRRYFVMIIEDPEQERKK